MNYLDKEIKMHKCRYIEYKWVIVDRIVFYKRDKITLYVNTRYYYNYFVIRYFELLSTGDFFYADL